MPTSTMNISLPESLKGYVRERVARDDYSTPSDYVRSLIRADRDRQQKLQALRHDIAIGIAESERGETVPFDETAVEGIKARGRARLAARK